MKTRKLFKRILSAVMSVIMLISAMALSVAAEEIAGNTWYGNNLSVDVTEGTEGYNYMSLFRTFCHGYEFGGHFMGEGEGPQTFVVIDTAKHDGESWSPNGVYDPNGSSNYDVVYCCDVETMIKDATYYKRVNLEDSEYYTETEARKIRAILTNAYPYVSVDTMKTDLASNGFAYAEELTRNEIIAAVQVAVWCCANGVEADDLRYAKSYKVSDNLQWGYPLYDTSSESGLDVSGKRVFESYEEVGTRIDSLVDYLLALEPIKANKDQIVISKLDIETARIDGPEAMYNVTVNVELNHAADSDDNITIKAYIDDAEVASIDVSNEKSYAFELTAPANKVIKVVASGTQYLEKGVYFYAPKPADINGDGVATSREVSQNLVGVAMGETPVYAEAEVEVVKKIDISGTKTWVDDWNRDGIRPTSVVVNLYADGNYVTSTTATAANGWNYRFYELPETKAGKMVNYTVSENPVAGYSANVDGYDITNTHVPATTSVSGTKFWDDANNQDGKRPESITVNLYANGEKVDSVEVTAANGWNYHFINLPKYEYGWLIDYTVKEEAVEGYTSVVEGYNITNTYAPEMTNVSGIKTWNDKNNQDNARPESITVNLLANGVEVAEAVVTAEDNWTWNFENLPKYEAGVEILYTITEDEVEGYTAEINGFDITNTLTPETVAFSGAKTWNDAEDQDGKRPESITINLLANGVLVDTVVVTAAENWAWSFENLDKYAAGEEIVYTITEDAVAGYTTEINGFNVTNTYIPETTTVSGAKTWNDANDQDGKRPESITVNLLANGVLVDTVVVTAANNWAWSFENLDKYAAGEEIVYTITEEAVAGYTTEINGFNVTNTYIPETTTVSGAKTWNDANDQDGKRPESITINLLANGVEVAEAVVTAEDNWAWNFENLPKYAAGVEIVYTITEDTVKDYSTEYDGYNVINSYVPGTTAVSGVKTWTDKNDIDGLRPESITINLLADGEIIDTAVVTAENGWTWNFAELPVCRDGGIEIVYTIEEEEVPGYTAIYDGYNVTNVHVTDARLTLDGMKYLDDEAGEGFEFILTDSNGTEIATAESNADGKFAFAELVYGKEGIYKYYITEKIGDDEGIAYDESKYEVIVLVNQNGNELTATAVVSKDGEKHEGTIEFNNETLIEIIEDPTPLDDAPKTADNGINTLLIFLCLLTASGVVVKSGRRRAL